MLVLLPDNNTRPEVEVLVHHLQQLPLGLLGGSVGEDGNGQRFCHTNGVGHLPERSDSGTYVLGEISQSRAAGITLPLLTGPLPLLPGSPSFLSALSPSLVWHSSSHGDQSNICRVATNVKEGAFPLSQYLPTPGGIEVFGKNKMGAAYLNKYSPAEPSLHQGLGHPAGSISC